jgi:hypothetical protein
MLCLAVDAVGQSHKRKNNQPKESAMKLNRTITLCAIAAALALSASTLLAQGNGGGFGGPGGMGGPGGGNFDPAQMQQMMMQRYQEQLGITNDTEWSAIQPLVQKVMDAQRGARGNMGRMFGRGGPGGGPGGRGGGPGGPGGFGQQQPDPTAEALQQAVENNAPGEQVKDLLAKYQAAQKAKQAALAAAQEDLRKVLSVQQEALATLMGLLN